MSNNNKRKSKILEILKKNYNSISMFLIPIILTSIFEGTRYYYTMILNEKGNTGITLATEFPWIKSVCFWIAVIIYVCLFGVVLFLDNRLKHKLFDNSNEEKNLKDAFLRLKEFGYKRQNCFKTDFISMSSASSYAEFLVTLHKKSIDLVVSTCLEFFKDSFSKQGSLVNEISFEVSFMTVSFIDNKITIVSSDNNMHRTPPSMLLRSLDPQIYDNTETGKIYKCYNANPAETLTIHIIEDCLKQNRFTALYEGQTDNIKSMAILPILSPQNKLLGTLVICANRADFFKEKERYFWNELLEIFSVELGYHFLALQYCINSNNSLPDQFKKLF